MEYEHKQIDKFKNIVKIITVCHTLLSHVLAYSQHGGQHTDNFNINTHKEQPPFTLPDIALPKVDLEQGNGIEMICWYPLVDNMYELTFIFADEDHPLVDKLYDRRRLHTYGTIQDIETMIVKTDASGMIKKLICPQVFAGHKQRNSLFHLHHTDILSWIHGSVLYINTWNHMFSLQDSNPQLSKHLHDGSQLLHFPVLKLSRAQLENQIQNGSFKDYIFRSRDQ